MPGFPFPLLIQLIAFSLIVLLTPTQVHRPHALIGGIIILGLKLQFHPSRIQGHILPRGEIVSGPTCGAGTCSVIIPAAKRLPRLLSLWQSDALHGINGGDFIFPSVLSQIMVSVALQPSAKRKRHAPLPEQLSAGNAFHRSSPSGVEGNSVSPGWN